MATPKSLWHGLISRKGPLQRYFPFDACLICPEPLWEVVWFSFCSWTTVKGFVSFIFKFCPTPSLNIWKPHRPSPATHRPLTPPPPHTLPQNLKASPPRASIYIYICIYIYIPLGSSDSYGVGKDVILGVVFGICEHDTSLVFEKTFFYFARKHDTYLFSPKRLFLCFLKKGTRSPWHVTFDGVLEMT